MYIYVIYYEYIYVYNYISEATAPEVFASQPVQAGGSDAAGRGSQGEPRKNEEEQ